MNEVAAFFHSSLSCSGADVISSRFQGFVADTVAHIGIAGILTSLVIFRDWPIRLFWAGFLAIIAKELAFDLPNAGWTGLVMFDSAWDLASWFLGFFAQWVLLTGRRV